MDEAGMGEMEKAEYDLMAELEQLESLKEEMEELGVASLADVEARMTDLSRKLDEIRGEGD